MFIEMFIEGYLVYLPIVYAIVSLLIVTLYGKKRLIALVYCGWLLYSIGPVIVWVVAVNLANMMDCAFASIPTTASSEWVSYTDPSCVVFGQDISRFYSQNWAIWSMITLGIGIFATGIFTVIFATGIFTAIWGGIFLIKKNWFNRRQTNKLAG